MIEKLLKKGEYSNKEIRAYLRENPHFTDDMVADHFNVSKRVVSANKSHITMGTDTDNPQERAKAVKKTIKAGLTLIKTQFYELRISEKGQYSRVDLVLKTVMKLTDEQAKNMMLNRLRELNG